MPVLSNMEPMVTGIEHNADGAHGWEYSPKGEGTSVSILPFEYPEESIEDRIAESIRLGGRAEDVIHEEIEHREMKIREETITALIGMIIGSDKPKLLVFQIAFAAGLAMVLNLSMEQVAKQFGITKQAMQQGIKKQMERLGLRKTRTMRSDEARRHMSLSNHRHTKR